MNFSFPNAIQSKHVTDHRDSAISSELTPRKRFCFYPEAFTTEVVKWKFFTKRSSYKDVLRFVETMTCLIKTKFSDETGGVLCQGMLHP